MVTKEVPHISGGIVAKARKKYENATPPSPSKTFTRSVATPVNRGFGGTTENRNVNAIGRSSGGKGRVPATTTARGTGIHHAKGKEVSPPLCRDSVASGSVRRVRVVSSRPPSSPAARRCQDISSVVRYNPTSNCSTSLLRQASDSGVSITSSSDEDNFRPSSLTLDSSTNPAQGSPTTRSPSVDISTNEITSETLKDLDIFNQQLLAEFAAENFDGTDSCLSRLEAATAVEVAKQTNNTVGDDGAWKTAWKELSGVTPSRRLLQLMRRLQSNWTSSSENNSALAHVTLSRSGGDSRTGVRPFLRGSALLDNSQKVAVASPSGALVASRGGQVRSYVNTKSLPALREDLLRNADKSNSEQNRDLVCLSTDSSQNWQVDNMTHQRHSPPTRPNRMKGRATMPLQYGKVAVSPCVDRKTSPCPQTTVKKQPQSPIVARKSPMNGQRNVKPQNNVNDISTRYPASSAIKIIPQNVSSTRVQTPSPSLSRRTATPSESRSPMPRSQLPPSPSTVRHTPPSPSNFRRNIRETPTQSPMADRKFPVIPSARSRDQSRSRHVASLEPGFRQSPAGLPKASAPREHLTSRSRCPQASSNVYHHPRNARSQTRKEVPKAQLRSTSSQPPVRRQDPNMSMSSKLKQDVLSAFGVKLNGASRPSPKKQVVVHHHRSVASKFAESPKFAQIATAPVHLSPCLYDNDEERKLSLESTSSGISGCSRDTPNREHTSFENENNSYNGTGPSLHSHIFDDESSSDTYTRYPGSGLNDTESLYSNNSSIKSAVLSERSTLSHYDNDLVIYENEPSLSSPKLPSNPRRSPQNVVRNVGRPTVVNTIGSKNKENKKHKSRVHLGGDGTTCNVNTNNLINNSNKNIKATTISINMGPVQAFSAPVARSRKASPATLLPSNSPLLPKKIGQVINFSRDQSVGDRRNPTVPTINKTSKAPKANNKSITHVSPNKSKDNSKISPCVPPHDTRTKEIKENVINQRKSRDNRSLCRDSSKPVSRLVRKGTFRVVEGRGDQEQDITPSLRLRYLMHRANSGEDTPVDTNSQVCILISVNSE